MLAYGIAAMPGRVRIKRQPSQPCRKASIKRLLPMPPWPSSNTARPSAQACAICASGSARPIKRGGRVSAAGNQAGVAAPAAVPTVAAMAKGSRSMVSSKASVSGAGCSPSSRHTCSSKRSKVATAATRSPRR